MDCRHRGQARLPQWAAFQYGSGLARDEHRYLHNSVSLNRTHDAKRVALDLAFDPRRPVKPRWPNAGLNPWATRQDA
ncbi:hypothetical protein EUX57_01180, partial [Pseudomonas orientalis]